MRVRINGVEVLDVTLDDLDELIKRYGGNITADSESGGGDEGRSRNNNSGGGTADRVLLRRFATAGTSGVTTSDIGRMLGRGGKATRPAAKEWAHRVGLTQEPGIDPFMDCRVGTNRGLRINDALLPVAQELAK